MMNPSRVANKNGIESTVSFNTASTSKKHIATALPVASDHVMLLTIENPPSSSAPQAILRFMHQSGGLAKPAQQVSDDNATEKRFATGAALSDGNYLLIWLTYNTSNFKVKVDGAIVNNQGVPIQGASTANLNFLPEGVANANAATNIAVLSDGHFLLCYFDSSAGIHQAQKFQNNGASVGSPFALTEIVTAGDVAEHDFDIVVTSTDKLVPIWIERPNANFDKTVYSRVLTKAGVVEVGSTALKSCPSCSTSVVSAVAKLPNDHLLLVTNTIGNAQQARVYDTSLTALTSEVAVGDFAGEHLPVVAMSNDVLAFVSNEAIDGDALSGKLYDANLAALGQNFPIAQSDGGSSITGVTDMIVVPLANSQLFAVWHNFGLHTVRLQSQAQLALTEEVDSSSYVPGNDGVDFGSLQLSSNQADANVTLTLANPSDGSFNTPSAGFGSRLVQSNYDTQTGVWQAYGHVNAINQLLRNLMLSLNSTTNANIEVLCEIDDAVNPKITQSVNIAATNQNLVANPLTDEQLLNDRSQMPASEGILGSTFKIITFDNGNSAYLYIENNPSTGNMNLFLQYVDANNNEIGSAVRVDTDGAQSVNDFQYDAAKSSDDRVCVVWTVFELGNANRRCYARCLSNTGGYLTSVEAVVDTATDEKVLHPKVTALNSGDFALALTRQFSGANDQLECYPLSNSLSVGNVTVVSDDVKPAPTSSAALHDLITLTNGEIQILWRLDDSNLLVTAKLAPNDFSLQGSMIPVVDAGLINDPLKASLKQADAQQSLVVWMTESKHTLHGVYVNFQTGAVSTPFFVGQLDPTSGYQHAAQPSLVMLANNRFFVASQDIIDGKPFAGKLFAVPSTRLGNAFPIDAVAESSQPHYKSFAFSLDQNGNLISVWDSESSGNLPRGLLQQRFYTGINLQLTAPTTSLVVDTDVDDEVSLDIFQVDTTSARGELQITVSDPDAGSIVVPATLPAGVDMAEYNTTNGVLTTQGKFSGLNTLLDGSLLTIAPAFAGDVNMTLTVNDGVNPVADVVVPIYVSPTTTVTSSTTSTPVTTTTEVSTSSSAESSTSTGIPHYSESTTTTSGSTSSTSDITTTSTPITTWSEVVTPSFDGTTPATQTSTVVPTTTEAATTSPVLAVSSASRLTPGFIPLDVASTLLLARTLWQGLVNLSGRYAQAEFEPALAVAQRQALVAKRRIRIEKLARHAKPFYLDEDDYVHDQLRWQIEDCQSDLAGLKTQQEFDEWDQEYKGLKRHVAKLKAGQEIPTMPSNRPSYEALTKNKVSLFAHHVAPMQPQCPLPQDLLGAPEVKRLGAV